MLEAIEISGATRRVLRGRSESGGNNNGRTPAYTVVLCHGFGADADDLAPLAQELDPAIEGADVRWIFPRAPYRFQVGWSEGRAWFPRDAAGIQSFMDGEVLGSLAAVDPPSFQMASREIIDLLAETGSRPERTVLGGFSQGAMVAVAAALEMETLPAGLLVFSGSIIARQRLQALAGEHADALNELRIAQYHGRDDVVLPYSSGQALAGLLESAGARVSFTPFPGGHGIPQSVLESARASLAAMIGVR